MAISVPNTISDLTLRARSLGILDSIKGTRKDGSYKKEDLIIPIRHKLLHDKYGDNIPDYLNLIQEIKSPMLSKRIDELNQDIQEEVWSDDNWDLEEKINGVRCIIIKDSSGIHVFSRDCSRVDLMPIQMPVNININLDSIKEDFILDCELESSNQDTCMFLKAHGIAADSNTQAIEILLTSLNPILAIKIQNQYDFQYVFNVFDCMYYNKSWVISETLEKRREIVSNIVKMLSGSGLNIRTVNHSNIDKKGFFNRCLASGFEGCVAKRFDSVYVPDNTRNSKGWIKIKRPKEPKQRVLADLSDWDNYESKIANGQSSQISSSKSSPIPFGDTIDAFITGFTPGEKGTLSENLIYSVDVSVWVLNKITNQYELKSLGTISHIEALVREQLTSIVNGLPTLNPVCYNTVVELDALCNVVMNFRYDKSAQDCILEPDTYSQIMNMKS